MLLKRGKEWKIFCCFIAMLSGHKMWKFQGAGWDYSILVTLYKIGKMSFHCFNGMNSFYAGSHYYPNLKYEDFRASFAIFILKFHWKASGTCSSIIFPHSTKQIIDLWCCHCCCRCHLLNSQFNLLWQCCVNLSLLQTHFESKGVFVALCETCLNDAFCADLKIVFFVFNQSIVLKQNLTFTLDSGTHQSEPSISVEAYPLINIYISCIWLQKDYSVGV